MAVRHGYPEIVKSLIEVRANLDAQDDDGRTALIWALIYKKLDDAKALVIAGASLHICDNNGKSAIEYANNDPTLFYAADKKNFKNLTEKALYTIEKNAISCSFLS